MAITQASYTLSATKTQIVSPSVNPQIATVHNLESANGRIIWIGGSDIVAGASVEINPTVFLQLQMLPGESLWAVTDGGAWQIGVMVSKL
jgi:hypothetical protein